jgi:ABC-type polar amino acid transport system ATPase subunit
MITLSPGMKKIETPAEQTIVTADDSIVVAIKFYTGKLRQLEYVLNQYNFFEHALQISALAKDIMEVKQKLKELEARKKALLNASNQMLIN